MADYPGWLVIVMPAALALGLGGLFALLRRPATGPEGRRRRMLAVAGELRLRYYGSVGAEALSSLPACALFQRARSDGLHNLMAENRNPPGVLVFDYGSGAAPARADAEREGYDQPPLYLVALVRLPAGARVTPARIYRRDWFGGPLDEEDLYSVRLPDAGLFGADFLVAGQPRDAVAGMLSEPVRGAVQSWTGRRPHPAVELMPGWVAAYVEPAMSRTFWMIDWNNRTISSPKSVTATPTPIAISAMSKAYSKYVAPDPSTRAEHHDRMRHLRIVGPVRMFLLLDPPNNDSAAVPRPSRPQAFGPRHT